MARAVGPEWRRAAAHLEQLANAHKTVQMARGLDQCVRILEPEVKNRVPILTGKLLRSIQSETRIDARGGPYGQVYTDVFYARFQEFGTGAGSGSVRWRRLKRKGVKAQRFFQRAWDQNKQRCKRILNGVVGKLVKYGTDYHR